MNKELIISEIKELREKINGNAFRGKNLTENSLKQWNKFLSKLDTEFGKIEVTYATGAKNVFNAQQWIAFGEQIVTNLKVKVVKIKNGERHEY